MKREDTIETRPSGNFLTPHQQPTADEAAAEKHRKFPVAVYLGCAVSILLVITVGVTCLFFSNQQKHKEQWVEHTYLVLDNIESVQRGIHEMTIDIRGFRVTGKTGFLADYRKRASAVMQKLTVLDTLAEDNPRQLAGIADIKEKTSDLINFWHSENMGSARSAAALTISETGKIDETGAAIDTFADRERSLLDQRESANRQLRGRAELTIITGTTLILIIVFVLIYFILREMTYRINAYQKEREMNQFKSSFVSLASHEFRTPLSTILLSTALVDKYGELHHDDNILKHSQKIKTAVNNLRVILEDFLSLEKLNAGKIKAKFQQFNLVRLCEDIAEEMSVILSPGQHLYHEHKGAESTVVLDENLLRNAIINLVTNAIKYAGDGATIELNTDISGDRLTISVKDNGIGIAEEDQKELFTPFYRINHTGKIPGTGLGLNIVQRYVKLMNGTIAFESKPMQGATFRMSFQL